MDQGASRSWGGLFFLLTTECRIISLCFILYSSILLSNGARLRISAAVTLKVVSVLSPAAPETSSDARQSSHTAFPAASHPQLPSRTHTCVCNIRLLRHLRTRRALQMGCQSQFVSGGVIRLLECSRWSEDLEAVFIEPGSAPLQLLLVLQ